MKKKWILAWLLCLLVVLFTACGSNSYSKDAAGGVATSSFDASYDAAMPAAAEDWDGGWTEEEIGDVAPAEEPAPNPENAYGGHKVIKTAEMSIRTKNFDEDLAYIKTRTAAMGGYVASSDLMGTKPEQSGDPGRSAMLVLRIPQDKLESFMDEARGIAQVTRESIGTQDITLQYTDTESRLAIYQTQYDRLMDLLKKADNMEDIVVIEQELARVTYEIESLTSTLKGWDDLIDFSTLTIDLMERNVIIGVSTGKAGLIARMGEGLVDSFNNLVTFFGNFLVFLVASLPVLIVLAILAVIIILIVKRSIKKRKQKKIAAEVETTTAAVITEAAETAETVEKNAEK